MNFRRALLVIAGLLVFVAVLVAYLPASWVLARVPASLQIACREINGSIWQGECIGLEYGRARLGDATWNLERLAALRGRFVGDADLRGTAMNARADLDITFKGTGELRNLVATLPLDHAFFPELPANQRGTVGLDLRRAEFVDARPRSFDGKIELRDLRQEGARPLELGSYRVEFDGKTSADGQSVGKLHDLGGPFAVDGTVTLTPPNSYLVQGFITGRTADAERIVRNDLALGAPPDTHGRTGFGFEGTF
jgi:hypothetical protein